jgi:hypothetical protein
VLGIDVNEIRASDNFFDLGGDSLMVLRAVQQTEQTLGLRVASRRYLFENLGQIASPSRTRAGAADTEPGELPQVPLGQVKSASHEGLLGRAFGVGGWLRKG